MKAPIVVLGAVYRAIIDLYGMYPVFIRLDPGKS
jgi:hypothetical protein